MKMSSLIVLGGVFAFAFAGRAAVLAAKVVDEGASASAPEINVDRCIDGVFAEELLTQSRRLEAKAINQESDDRKREVLLEHINNRIAELERLNAALGQTAERMKEADTAPSSKVAGLYERMKPNLAGAIIGEMDPKFAAGLLKSMSPDSASEILAAIAPGRAYAITVLMSEPA
jgi:flagellar motility protein MotE (MotC chaperone)